MLDDLSDLSEVSIGVIAVVLALGRVLSCLLTMVVNQAFSLFFPSRLFACVNEEQIYSVSWNTAINMNT